MLEAVHLFQGLEDFVGQHAVGHFVAGDLLQQGLILAVVVGGVEFAAEVLDLVLARLELKLFLVGGHAHGLELGLGLGQRLFGPLHVGIGGANLFRSAITALSQIGQLTMNAMDGAEDGDAGIRGTRGHGSFALREKGMWVGC